MRCPATACVAFVLIGMTGCAHYEYDLTQPPPLARHIGADHDQRIDIPPLVYVLRTYENRLVMRIQNPTDQPIELLGTQSFVVSPDGQSHPLPGQTIAPGSFIKLILPPMPPEIRPSGPSIGIGVGVVGHVQQDSPAIPSQPAGPASQPVYLQIAAQDGAYYWTWDDETDIRMLLIFRQNDRTFEHDFAFHRRRM